jgi:hypothetical protein
MSPPFHVTPGRDGFGSRAGITPPRLNSARWGLGVAVCVGGFALGEGHDLTMASVRDGELPERAVWRSCGC